MKTRCVYLDVDADLLAEHVPYPRWHLESMDLRVVESLDGKEVGIYEVIFWTRGRPIAWTPFTHPSAEDVALLRLVNRKVQAALRKPVLKVTRRRGTLSLMPKRAAHARAQRKRSTR